MSPPILTPTAITTQLGIVRTYLFDANATRYEVTAVRIGGDLLLAAAPDDRFGRTWYRLGAESSAYLSDEYIAEKWRVRQGDLEPLGALIRYAYADMTKEDT